MLTLTNITKSYPGKKNAVENVSLSIPRGEIVGLFGETAQARPL